MLWTVQHAMTRRHFLSATLVRAAGADGGYGGAGNTGRHRVVCGAPARCAFPASFHASSLACSCQLFRPVFPRDCLRLYSVVIKSAFLFGRDVWRTCTDYDAANVFWAFESNFSTAGCAHAHARAFPGTGRPTLNPCRE